VTSLRRRSISTSEKLSALESRAALPDDKQHEQVASLRRRSIRTSEQVAELHSRLSDPDVTALRARVKEAAAFRSEWRDGEADSERLHVEASQARRSFEIAESARDALLATVESDRKKLINEEAQLRNLRQELTEAQEEAQRRDDSYWDDAPFLMASADVVDGYHAEIAHCNKVSQEIVPILDVGTHVREVLDVLGVAHEGVPWCALDESLLPDNLL